MNKSLAHIRKEYSQRSLDKGDVSAVPAHQFSIWLDEAIGSGALEATAMNLATADTSGKPTSRIVLLKGIDQGNFLFYTNYKSHKGITLETNSFAAINFFRPELERQVRIEGKIEKVSAEESDVYFQIRPYGSRIGAWVSEQSKKVDTREELEKRVKEYMEKYPEGSFVPRPEFWGGYRLIPSYFEFWQGQPSRLHDRIVYELKEDGQWDIYRICP